MINFKKVKATIIKIEGAKNAKCSFGHQIGEEFIFTEFGCDKPLCVYALNALLASVNVLLHEGKFPWLPKTEKLFWGCPHPGDMYEGLGQVIFELEVIE